jgi:hypothetical protein
MAFDASSDRNHQRPAMSVRFYQQQLVLLAQVIWRMR